MQYTSDSFTCSAIPPILYSCSLNLLENIPLAPLTTFAIGGPARWFVEAASEDDIVETTAWARRQNTPLFVLGGGSNLLVSDAGFDGLVLKVALRGIAAAPEDPAHRIYQAAAGEPWEHCVQQTMNDNCAGLECLAGIPGTVGGTPVQNVGAYGQEVASVIHRVRAFDLVERAFIEFTAADCAFAYRRSRFNSTDRGRFIVTRVDYRLTPGGAPKLQYAELQRVFEAGQPNADQPTLAEVAAAVRSIRRSKGMLLVEGDPDCRSAGSFFKNPIVSEDLFQRIAARTAPRQPPGFPAGDGQLKLSAAWLIEQAGFARGYALGNAGLSSRHTLALINHGGAGAAEIVALATQIRDRVAARFAVQLEMEPIMVGF